MGERGQGERERTKRKRVVMMEKKQVDKVSCGLNNDDDVLPLLCVCCKAEIKKEEEADKLTMKELLEMLDGVIDTPGRILVMVGEANAAVT